MIHDVRRVVASVSVDVGLIERIAPKGIHSEEMIDDLVESHGRRHRGIGDGAPQGQPIGACEVGDSLGLDGAQPRAVHLRDIDKPKVGPQRRVDARSHEAHLERAARGLVEVDDVGCRVIGPRDPLDGDASRLLFSNPASKAARDTGTIRLSYDEGKTWSVAKLLYAGGFAYSCLTRLADGRIGCLFERDDYATLTFARFTLEWLTDGIDRG